LKQAIVTGPNRQMSTIKVAPIAKGTAGPNLGPIAGEVKPNTANANKPVPKTSAIKALPSESFFVAPSASGLPPGLG
jgi:hypothetical protein